MTAAASHVAMVKSSSRRVRKSASAGLSVLESRARREALNVAYVPAR